MAEALVRKIEKNFLACSICFEQLNDPIGLPCLHAYCFECIQNWHRACGDKSPVVCPACKKPATLPEDGIRGFPGHFLMKNLKETVDREKMKAESSNINVGNTVRIKKTEDVGIVQSIAIDVITVKLPSSFWLGMKCEVELWTAYDNNTTCELCDRPAKYHCLDCKQYLCNQCCHSHNAFKAMKKHEIVAASDVLSGEISNEGRHCEVHDEPVKYYCMTETKQVCQDCVSLKICPIEHNRVPLANAARQHASSLQQLLVECDKKKDTFLESLVKTDQVRLDLKMSYEIAQEAFENVISETTAMWEKEKSTHAEKEETLTNFVSDLTSQYINAKETCNKVSEVITNGSDYDITYKYTEMKATLENIVSAPDPEVAAESLSDLQFNPGKPDNYINTEAATLCEATERQLYESWELLFEFETTENFGELVDVADCPDQNVVVVSRQNGVKVFSSDGQIRSTLRNAPRIVNSVAVTPDERILIDGRAKVLCYDKEGKLLGTIKSTLSNDSRPVSVAVDSKGRIIAGLEDGTICIHYADGTLQSQHTFAHRPYYISATSRNTLAVTFANRSLAIVNYEGDILNYIQSPYDGGEWDPGYTCCSPQGEIYVINDGLEKEIYGYNCDGEFLGWTGMFGVRGIAFSQDGNRLLVVEGDGCVKNFLRLS